MIVTIHQPDFLPWLGFFDRWARSDLLILLDDVQFLRRGWHHRDRIKTAGGVKWLTVPVQKGKREELIRNVRIDNASDWRRKHLEALRHAYSKAPAYPEVAGGLEAVYGRNHEGLMELNVDLLHFVADKLGIVTPVRYASEFSVSSTSTQRLVDLVGAVGGTTYLTGTGSRDYLNERLFRDAGIDVVWQRFEQHPYPQLHGDFEPGLSVVDALMNAHTQIGRG